jgi:cytochrome c biogenesis protein CcdA/thiol-disulfide isomerase/thioredoxin
MLLLLGFAFLSGLVTILQPCIWPLLPIVLSSSISGDDHKRPLGVTLWLMVSFAIFTLFISVILNLLHIDPTILRMISVVVIGFFGLLMLVPGFGSVFEVLVSRLSGKFGSLGGGTAKRGFGGGFVTGLSLGIVWAPCAGPILGAVTTLSLTGHVSFAIVLVTFAYVLGVGIPLFIFALLGQRIFTRTRGLSAYTGRIQQIFGIIMIITAFFIYKGWDTILENKLLGVFPAYSQYFTSLESNPTVKKQLDSLQGRTGDAPTVDSSGLLNVTNQVLAPEFAGIIKWFPATEGPLAGNAPLTMRELRGHVVLVDFWAFSCLNCQRTLPYVTKWYDKYAKYGFVVIGVHAPEFAFEKNLTNLGNAIKQFGIHYPVAADNDLGTWNAFQNNSWPAEYLIDKDGYVRRFTEGEGDYGEQERAIQLLLTQAGANVPTNIEGAKGDVPDFGNISRETYLGADRMQYLYPNGSTDVGVHNFTAANDLPINQFSFDGTWNITQTDAVSSQNAAIVYHFKGENVYLTVMDDEGKPEQVRVFLDGKLVTSGAGSEVKNGILTITNSEAHEILSFPKTEEHTMRVEFLTPGTEIFTVQFG